MVTIIKCNGCGKKFDDKMYKKVGIKLAKRVWCDKCVKKLWEKRKNDMPI